MITRLDIDQPKPPAPQTRGFIAILTELTIGPVLEFWPEDLQAIGEFTRTNIASWLNRVMASRDRFVPIAAIVCEYGWQDFHAVCGDIDIPWEKEESRLAWEKVHRP